MQEEEDEEEMRRPRATILNPAEIDMDMCKELYRRYEMPGNDHRTVLYFDLESGLARERSDERL